MGEGNSVPNKRTAISNQKQLYEEVVRPLCIVSHDPSGHKEIQSEYIYISFLSIIIFFFCFLRKKL
jgi:hypothetical protein